MRVKPSLTHCTRRCASVMITLLWVRLATSDNIRASASLARSDDCCSNTRIEVQFNAVHNSSISVTLRSTDNMLPQSLSSDAAKAVARRSSRKGRRRINPIAATQPVSIANPYHRVSRQSSSARVRPYKNVLARITADTASVNCNCSCFGSIPDKILIGLLFTTLPAQILRWQFPPRTRPVIPRYRAPAPPTRHWRGSHRQCLLA